MRSYLHVANGTCTTGLISAAGIHGALSIWADPLFDGPVPGGLGDEELIEIRTRHLSGGAPADRIDDVNDLRRWRSIIDRHESYDELVLWFEHDLFDQLNLVQLLSWVRHRLPASRTVSLICVGSFPGHPRFKGLGELTPEELAPLFQTRRPVDDEQYAVAERAWQAFRDDTPVALDQLRRTDISALPFLAAALTRFLQEFPSTADGLSRTERRLLQLASGGPIELSTAFPRMHDGEDAYYITDTSFVDLVEALSTGPSPLVAIVRASPPGKGFPEGTLTLTSAGRKVLDGEMDRIDLCGIDRWLGGVHLQRGTNEWRWDEESETMKNEERRTKN